MKRMTALLSAATFVLATTVVFAQAPSFAGKWTRVDDPAAAAGGGAGRGGRGGGLGAELTITQDASTLTIASPGADGATTTRAYKLDGSESVNQMAGRGGMVEQTSTAAWQDGKLVITTQAQNGATTQTWSLVNGELHIEQAGGRGGPTTLVYRKAS